MTHKSVPTAADEKSLVSVRILSTPAGLLVRSVNIKCKRFSGNIAH
jgi:hypothetical protein